MTDKTYTALIKLKAADMESAQHDLRCEDYDVLYIREPDVTWHDIDFTKFGYISDAAKHSVPEDQLFRLVLSSWEYETYDQGDVSTEEMLGMDSPIPEMITSITSSVVHISPSSDDFNIRCYQDYVYSKETHTHIHREDTIVPWSYNKGDQRLARFVPKDPTTIKDKASSLIGNTYSFTYLWLITEEDSEHYAGQIAWGFPHEVGNMYGIIWAPDEDLQDVIMTQNP